MNSKEYFFNTVIGEYRQNRTENIRVLELGCGTAPYVKTLIDTYPNLEYVGIEPIEMSYKKAVNNLQDVPRTSVIHQLGYGEISLMDAESFDIVISFSVLEHVKQLGKFMDLAGMYTKKGGMMVHRYDLGHALYPTTLKEKMHVWLGNTFPALLPERTFVRYVPLSEVEVHFKRVLCTPPFKYTYHQIPQIKNLTKTLDNKGYTGSALEEIYAWEFTHAHTFASIEKNTRELLFPTVAVWGKKS